MKQVKFLVFKQASTWSSRSRIN